MNDLDKEYEFRGVRPGEAEDAAAIEAASFPPSEACTLPIMRQRVDLAPDLFFVAIERSSGRKVGFTTAIATDERKLRDEFFTDTSLHNPQGKQVMILSLAVLEEYRRRGIATRLMKELLASQTGKGRERAVLTCIPVNVKLYEGMGYTDGGVSQSEWGGELWHEMTCRLK